MPPQHTGSKQYRLRPRRLRSSRKPQLHRLRKPAPLYTPLDETRNSIRLFVLAGGDSAAPIVGELIQCELDQNMETQYEALSYCWESDHNSGSITLNGQDFEVAGNLLLALTHLRHPESPRILWIDAICIDQKNIEERSRQVRRMGSIYGYASMVHVWLGPEDGFSSYGMTLLAFLASGQEMSMEPPLLLGNDISDTTHCYRFGLRSIYMRSWFGRLWVVQEAALARRITLTCGKASFSWVRKEQAPRFLRRLKFASIAPKWRSICRQGQVDFTPLVDLLELSITNEANRLPVPDLLDLCYGMRHKHASDPRDMVYGLIGLDLVRCSSPIVPDYKLSVDEVIYQLLDHVKNCPEHPPI